MLPMVCVAVMDEVDILTRVIDEVDIFRVSKIWLPNLQVMSKMENGDWRHIIIFDS